MEREKRKKEGERLENVGKIIDAKTKNARGGENQDSARQKRKIGPGGRSVRPGELREWAGESTLGDPSI